MTVLRVSNKDFFKLASIVSNDTELFSSLPSWSDATKKLIELSGIELSDSTCKKVYEAAELEPISQRTKSKTKNYEVFAMQGQIGKLFAKVSELQEQIHQLKTELQK